MVGTSELNRFVFSMLEKNPVVVNRSGGRRLKVKYVSQVKAGPPTFLFFTNRSKGIPENYKRYLRNGLRRTFELDNTPVHLVFRTGTDLEKRMKKIGRK
jgi:GTP-binding protein